MKFKIIACINNNNVLGKDNSLIYNIKNDLSNFKRITMDGVVVMGRKTWESLPDKYKCGRTVVVFSQKHRLSQGVWISSLAEYEKLSLDSPFLIGGAELFDYFFQQNLLKACFVTHIQKTYPGDTYFPVKHLLGWKRKRIRQTENFAIYYYENYAD